MKENYNVIKRCLWTVLIVMVVQIGGKFQLPSTTSISENALGVMKIFASISAGNGTKLALFSLGLGPYMTMLILWNTISMLDIDVINSLSEKQVGIIQRLVTLVFSVFQGFIAVLHFEEGIFYGDFPKFSRNEVNLAFVLILVSGAMIVTFLAEMNKKMGVGKQMVLILPGLLTNIPTMLVSGQVGAGRELFTNSRVLIMLVILTVIFIYLLVFLYKGEYRIKVQRTAMDVIFENSYIPIKVLSAGALPFMFGITLFSLPMLLVQVPIFQRTTFIYIVIDMFSYTTLPGVLIYGLILCLLGYGFSYVNVRAHDIAKSLRNSGDYILEVIPGEETEKYIKKKLNGMIVVNNVFMLLISIIPMLIGLKIPGVTNLAFYFASIYMVVTMLVALHEEVKFMLAKSHYKVF
ncbi:accessory Sec system protein translocase subunit SecY2 [Pseudolactococcus yaeyamensis]